MQLIESEYWRLWSDPDIGVQWLAAQIKKDDTWLDVMPDCKSSHTDSQTPPAGQATGEFLKAASFHMLPYSNRVRDGRFTFAGMTHQLQHPEKHAIHGAVRGLPWRTVEVGRQRLVCEIDTGEFQNMNWPWRCRARLIQQVEGHQLISTLELQNLDSSAMPAGGGWHPYFVREINGSQPTLTLPVSGVFPDANGDCLPDGPAVVLPDALDFRHPRLLDSDQRIDCCLSGLSGTTVIHWQQAGIKLSIEASDECRFLVLYNPAMPHFAVEPVTNANDAFNLHHKGIDAGVQVLEAGERMTIRMTMTVAFDD